jgi:uncharacterized protein with HEPN domain
MPSHPTDHGWLWDMLQASRLVVIFVAGRTLSEYESDPLLRSGVERQIEIIGEAARHVSKEFRDQHPEIPWKPIMAQRHVLAHDYGEIRNDLVYRVATVHVPALVGLLQPLVPTAPPATEAHDSDPS